MRALRLLIKRYRWQMYLIYLAFTGGLFALVWTLWEPKIAVVALGGASLLAMPALHLVMLKYGGAALSRDTRLWIRLKVLWYGLLLLFVVVSAVGLPRWWQLGIGVALLVLMLASGRVKRRALDDLRGRDSQPA